MWNCCDSRGRRSRHDVPHTPAGLDRRGTFCSRSSHIERGNDLATIVSILRLQARSETDPGVQRAIASAVSRVDVAKVHDRLRETADTSRIALAGHRVLMRQPCGFSPGRAHDLDPGPLRGHLGEEFAGGLDRADRQRTASSTHFRRAAAARWRSSCGPRKPTFWCR
ncbi:histidine kinase dimerization/phosphoacceptor domain -containing protein [Bradyrhizobium lupini]|uniref:histidine kinase dimerization/phosphoacceptor domain -containing protein n=1 Tax=Rhizobium lupini TaxID=136996 RepID=UPI0034C6C1CF